MRDLVTPHFRLGVGFVEDLRHMRKAVTDARHQPVRPRLLLGQDNQAHRQEQHTLQDGQEQAQHAEHQEHPADDDLDQAAGARGHRRSTLT